MVMRRFYVVPAYAPGTIVMLSSGHQCVVTRWSHDTPCCPVVETLVLLGKSVDPIEFDLRQRKGPEHRAGRGLRRGRGQL